MSDEKNSTLYYEHLSNILPDSPLKVNTYFIWILK